VLRATLGVLCAAAALWLAIRTSMDVSMAGFPDGYITDYGKAVATPLRIVTWVALGLAAIALGIAVAPMRSRLRITGLLVTLVAVAALAFITWVGVPWYFGTHLGLDNGVGG